MCLRFPQIPNLSTQLHPSAVGAVEIWIKASQD